MKKNIEEAITFHVGNSLKVNDPVPEIFKGDYELEFILSTEGLLDSYSGIFTKAALSRVTWINERQL